VLRRKEIKSLLSTVLLLVCLAGCKQPEALYMRRTAIFFDYFDTAIQLIAEVKSEEEFKYYAEMAEERFAGLHCLFDIYNTYPGINNIRTINDNAGGEKVTVDKEIISLLCLAVEGYHFSSGLVDITLGPVLSLWHDLRRKAAVEPSHAMLPDFGDLSSAYLLRGMEDIIIDTESHTVHLIRPGMSLDVGSVAKGYATELVAEMLYENGLHNFLIDAGGNVCSYGKPLSTDKQYWSIGLQSPLQGSYNIMTHADIIDVVYTQRESVVSSGGYIRFYEVDDVRYHHIIDPRTLYPADGCLATTVITSSSAYADLFSTITFLLSPQEAFALAEELSFALLIVLPDGSVQTNTAMVKYLQSKGATPNP